MNRMLVLLWCLASVTFAYKPSNVCEKQLQGIMSRSPSSTCTADYFAQIERELRKFSPLLFSSEAESVFENLETTYGVSITSTPPFGYKCSVYSNTTSLVVNSAINPFFFSFDNSMASSQPITSLTVSLKLTTDTISNVKVGLQYFQASSSVQSIYLLNGNCGSRPAFLGTVEDGGLAVASNCNNLNAGLTFAAVGGSIMNSLTTNGVLANSPIYLSAMKNSEALPSFTFVSANITICTTNPVSTYTYDIAKSNLNVPGLRYDAGVYFYTTVIRDEYGQMQYITISASKSSISC